MSDRPAGAAARGGGPSESPDGPWQDPDRAVDERVGDLLGRMTLEEKAGQLVGYWAAHAGPGERVAPLQDAFADQSPSFELAVSRGLGQLTRVYGTAPVSPAEGARRLLELQGQVAAGNRFGIAAIAHEECLTGVAAHTATIFPCPLAWAATFDAGLTEEMSAAIGSTLRRMGVHQGLAPVMDVARDHRWGRTEETMGEDPVLVGALGAAYVRGLEQQGIAATLKHFAGYSASRAGRNFAPAALGPRELADVMVEPFAVALREGGARCVMHSYADIDGVPAAADEGLLTGLLRDELGFDGVVVADYYGIAFLQRLHGVAASPGQAAALALRAGVDVELPTANCYGEPLLEQVRQQSVPEHLIDRAAARVLRLKCQLGLLDPTWRDDLEALVDAAGTMDLDPPEHRDLAGRMAARSIVLLANDGLLPLEVAEDATVAIVGPLGDDPLGMLGCYSFPLHVGLHHDDVPIGVAIPTLAEAMRDELAGVRVTVAPGCGVTDALAAGPSDEDSIAAAVEVARAADACVLALGDRAGLFGRGTSGEGCDTDILRLPGRQQQLAEAVLATGTPTAVVLLSGRPYALDETFDAAGAIVQAFFPGEEGGPALARLLTGRAEPSGRLPVSIPQRAGGQPSSYLHARLAGPTEVSAVDPSPRFAFGHGLTWTTFGYRALDIAGDGPHADVIATDGTARISCVVTNTGERAGTELVQLYLSDPVATVVRPVRWLAGWISVRLEAGASARVTFEVHADRTAFSGRDRRRVVEPGEIGVEIGASSRDLRLLGSFRMQGPVREPGRDRVLGVAARHEPW